MIASGCPSNQALQMLDAADLDLLRPHLATVEMVRKSVLSEAGAALKYVYFPHGGSASITVGLSEGQMIEVATLGQLVPIANISRRKHDGPCDGRRMGCRRSRFGGAGTEAALGNDGALGQRIPVRTVGRRL